MSVIKKLQELAESALEELGIKNASVDIYLASDDSIAEINYRHRKKKEPTTVLSFPAADGPYPEIDRRPLGEIYLAPCFIKKKKQNINGLLIHGLLHLAGYNHRKRSESQKMEAKEAELKQKLLV